MAEPNEALFIDLLLWLSSGDRAYDEVMEAWRTSCPRLTIWEDAVSAGWVERRKGGLVSLTDLGRLWLTQQQAGAA